MQNIKEKKEQALIRACFPEKLLTVILTESNQNTVFTQTICMKTKPRKNGFCGAINP
jgi:hypothetical protein